MFNFLPKYLVNVKVLINSDIKNRAKKLIRYVLKLAIEIIVTPNYKENVYQK